MPPTKVILSRGLSNSYELNIGFFFQHNYQLYQCDIRQPKVFRRVLDLQSVTDVVSHRFVSNYYTGIVQIIPKPIARNIQSASNINKDGLDMVIMKERM